MTKGSIDEIANQIEMLIAGMPYDVSLDDDELRGEIRRNKSFLLEGLKKGVSEERISKMARLEPLWWGNDIDAGKVWISGPNTGKGVGLAKLSEEFWKEQGKLENIYDVPYPKGILTLPEIDDETRKKIIRQINAFSDTMSILQPPEVMSKTDTVQVMEQESNGIILVRWDEIDCGEYYGETQFCKSWEEAVEYMVKTKKKKYEIEVDEDDHSDI